MVFVFHLHYWLSRHPLAHVVDCAFAFHDHEVETGLGRNHRYSKKDDPH
jgi:hypothetical protein